MSLRVTRYGEPVLRQTGEPVESFDSELKSLADAMVETMYAEEGIGLAAHQVGRPILLCVIDINFDEAPPDVDYILDGRTPPLDLIMPLVLVNPSVTPLTEERKDYEEGCLSFPDIRAVVNRPERVRCEYQDLDGNAHVLECNGLLARVILHEVDHLNGVLFIDRLERRELKKIESKVKKLKRETRDFLRKQP